jgi:branched-chain amino acid transport system substrate-binding protein
MSENDNHRVDRRTVLKGMAATGTVGVAGCLGGGGSVDSVRFGILNPMSGDYQNLGPGQRNGAELGVKWVNESDEFDFEVEAFYEDTETGIEAAQRKAERLVQEDQVSFLTGSISSSVGLGLNDFAKQNQVLYAATPAAKAITGSKCSEWVFRFETNTSMIAEACAPWTIENLGGNVWFHVADYAYGNSVLEEWRGRMEGMSSYSEVDVSKSELGNREFDPFITDIANSDADVAVIGMTGGDLITFMGQARQAGLLDEVDVMTTTGSFAVIRGALGQAAAGFYSGVRYNHQLETGDNQEFVSRYQEEYDALPDNFERVAFESIRTVARGVKEAGSNDPADVKDALPGLGMPTIFGDNQFRECDHQATNPVWVGQNVGSDDAAAEDPATVDIIQRVDGGDAIPACSETGCSM